MKRVTLIVCVAAITVAAGAFPAATVNCGHGTFTAGKCYCIPGYAKDTKGMCTIAATTPKDCGHGIFSGGRCICQRGYGLDAGGRCTVTEKK